jgi:methylated-DNA-[protein]-cysteine S-methyltransferase
LHFSIIPLFLGRFDGKRWGEVNAWPSGPEFFTYASQKGTVLRIYQTFYKSPIGHVRITATRDSILTLDFVEKSPPDDDDLPLCMKECVKQIAEYFEGRRKSFLLNLAPRGTEFQRLIWRRLEKIPFGSVVSYRELAGIIGKPNAFRAVGNANGKNPISIIIPCHRVVGSNGSLTGYGGGLWRKEWLLAHERGDSTDHIKFDQ